MEFGEWFAAFLECAEQEDCPVNESDKEAYRGYFDDGYSPLDAVMEELSNA